MLVAFALSAYAVCFAAAGASDLVRFEIPNALGLALVAAFLPVALSLPLSAAGAHVAAGLSMLVLASVCFGLGLMGGGDAKLLAAAALWMGWRNLAPFVLLTALAGACLGMLLLALRRLLPRPPEPDRWYSRVLDSDEGVPYGLAISGAALALLPRLAASL